MASTPKYVRGEIEIDAPIERAWQILTDVDRYGEWNPFTRRSRRPTCTCGSAAGG